MLKEIHSLTNTDGVDSHFNLHDESYTQPQRGCVTYILLTQIYCLRDIVCTTSLKHSNHLSTETACKATFHSNYNNMIRLEFHI